MRLKELKESPLETHYGRALDITYDGSYPSIEFVDISMKIHGTAIEGYINMTKRYRPENPSEYHAKLGDVADNLVVIPKLTRRVDWDTKNKTFMSGTYNGISFDVHKNKATGDHYAYMYSDKASADFNLKGFEDITQSVNAALTLFRTAHEARKAEEDES